MPRSKLKKELLNFISKHPHDSSLVMFKHSFIRVNRGNILEALRQLIREKKIEEYVSERTGKKHFRLLTKVQA